MGGKKLLDEEFIARIEQLELVSRKVIAGVIKGDRLSRRRGHSHEFADLRPYVAGDDLRFLDWNIYARLDRLFLKLFLEEEDLRLSILLDRSPSMDFGHPNKLEFACKLSAALAYIGLVHQDRVELLGFAEAPQCLFGPARGRRHVRRLLEVLENLEAADSPRTDLERACRDVALTRRGGGILLILSDLLDRAGVERGLRYLLPLRKSTEIFVFHVLAPEETAPDLAGDLRLVDLEDGMVEEVSVSAALLKEYQRTLERFCAEVRACCARAGMQYVPTPTAMPFDRLILEYLARRGLVR